MHRATNLGTPVGPQDLTLRKNILSSESPREAPCGINDSLVGVRFSENWRDEDMRERLTLKNNEFAAMAVKHQSQILLPYKANHSVQLPLPTSQRRSNDSMLKKSVM